MNTIHVEASAVIDASPEKVYAVVADYHTGHPAIVPKQYFTSLTVESGGLGAGTVVRGTVKVLGTEYPLHHQVSEPEPGRVLVETDLDTGDATRFTFEPLNGGRQTRVTIATDFVASPGLAGFLEKLSKPRVARDMYQKELRNLAEYVQK